MNNVANGYCQSRISSLARGIYPKLSQNDPYHRVKQMKSYQSIYELKQAKHNLDAAKNKSCTSSKNQGGTSQSRNRNLCVNQSGNRPTSSVKMQDIFSKDIKIDSIEKKDENSVSNECISVNIQNECMNSIE